MKASHKERIQAAIRGEKADRPAVALWRHFPVDDQHPGLLAAAVLHFQQTYDFDLVKVTPASSFCLKDWGVEDKWTGSVEGTRAYTRRVISGPEDWARLPVLDPTSTHLAAQLTCLRLIRPQIPGDTPLLQTVFSPLAQAKNLAGNETLIAHLRLYPEAVMQGLQTIAETTRRFVESARETGIDGIFYAIQHAQAGLLTLEEYKTFGIPFDLQALEPSRGLWCNLLHLHGHNIHFSILDSFDFQIINWHDRETKPGLTEARKQFRGAQCGGMRQDTLVYGDQAEVREEAREALEETQGRGFILGTGCVVPIIASHGNILAARQSVE